MVRMLVRKCHTTWRPEDPATPFVLDSLFDDMGIGTGDNELDQEAREAVRRYCIDAMMQAVCSGHDLGIGHVENMAQVFYDAYKIGWRDSEGNILRS